jgi:hypothetical protein
LIIPMIIQTILLDPSRAVWSDSASTVSRPDPSGADQTDAEHPTPNRKIEGSSVAVGFEGRRVARYRPLPVWENAAPAPRHGVARRYGPAEEGGASSSWPCSLRAPVVFSGATVVVGSLVVVGSVVVVVVGSVVVVGWVVVTAPNVVVDGEPAGTGPGAAVEAGGAVVLRRNVTC